MSEESTSLSFELIGTEFETIVGSRDFKEQLLQYNLDQTLKVLKFRFAGQFSGNSLSEYEDALKFFFQDTQVLSYLNTSGEPAMPIIIESENLSVDVMSMSFFDRLTENGIVGPGGRIKGCFDDTFDGIMVGDLLREMLLNENSENSCIYNELEKTELIYSLFKLFAVGGSLCQPETQIEKYLDITKSIYKELVTVYKDSKTNVVKVAGRAFKIKNISGVTLFPESSDSPHNVMIVLVDPMKRIITVVKNSFKDFW